MREEYSRRIQAEKEELNVETHSIREVHVYEIENAERNVQNRLNLEHENEMKAAKMEHIRAMGVLREEHATQLLEVQQDLDKNSSTRTSSLNGKKNSSGGLFSKFWR